MVPRYGRETRDKERAREREIRSNRRNKSPYLTRNGTLWHFSMDGYRWILSPQSWREEETERVEQSIEKGARWFLLCYERNCARTTKRTGSGGINGRGRQIKRRMKERWRLDEETGPSSDGTRGPSRIRLSLKKFSPRKRAVRPPLSLSLLRTSPFVFDKEEG